MDKIIKESLDKMRLLEKNSTNEDWSDWKDVGSKVVKGGEDIVGSIGKGLKYAGEHPTDAVKGIGQTAIDVVKDSGATMATGYAAGKAASKILGKKIPGVGTALYGKDAYDRFKKGDYTGAALQGAGAVASLIPGIGTAATLGIDAATAAKDYYNNDDSDIESTDPNFDPDIAAIQQELVNKGEKIKVDGIFSDNLIVLGKKHGFIKEEKMNNDDLRYYINLIEKKGPFSRVAAAKGPAMGNKASGWDKVKNKAASGWDNVKNKAASNPVATTLTGAAVGAGVTAALSGDKLPPSTAQPSSSGTPSTATASKPAAKPASQGAKLTPQEEQELNVLSVDMEKVAKQNPEIAKLLDKYYEVYGK